MRAVVQHRYGGVEDLELTELPTPLPAPDQLLVRVLATSLNLSDWEGLRGRPAYARIGGLRRPARPVPGSDIAGVVEAVGADVTGFGPGDEVYADNLGLKGGFGELAVVPAQAAAPKPPGLTFVQASTIPQAGPIALQGTAGAGQGTRILINGAGGGSGAFAVQLAVAAGAEVTAVDNVTKLDFLRSLGAAKVIDHRTTDFAATGERYDLVLDLVAERSIPAVLRSLRAGGRYRAVGGPVSTLVPLAIGGLVARPFTDRRIGLLVVADGPERFTPLAERVLAGDVDVHVDRTVGLAGVPEAMAAIGAGAASGKIVVEPAT
ncbi:MAG: NAD(P)-dependent alcohol dehydrogenase [Actinomycetota bacterium]